MPIDYSKWDHIELSDDSDIEVHPNVDKNSFIKWKQRDIHEKRQQRNIEIKSILVQLTMYAKLNERVDYLLENSTKEQLLDNKALLSTLDAKFDKTEKFDYKKLIAEKGDTLRKGLKDLTFDPEETQNTPCYNEMIEDLLIQVRDDHPDAKTNPVALVQYLKEHRNKIDDVLSKQTIKLDDLLYQKSLLISSEDYHTGFDSSFLNKDEDDAESPVSKEERKKETEKVTTIETINSPSTNKAQSSGASSSNKPKSEKEVLGELELLPQTEEFAKIPSTELKESATFLLKHNKICTEQQKDALIMTAFDLQLEGKSKQAKQVIHQSLLLQYIAQLAGPHPNSNTISNAIKLFIGKISDSTSPAKAGFYQDVDSTFNHIKTRCEVIQSEHEAQGEEEEALIQLKALDEGTELSVSIPEEGTKEYEIFTTKLSKEFQDAVKTQSLDEVNKEFAKLKVEEAEKVLEIFNECGVIGITDYLEDEKDFQELQKQYKDDLQHESQLEEEEKEKETEVLLTEDTVD
ncbi:Cdc37 N terminal kinase binding-domain-containing protein [Scheffersomyces xylosifermentans]|uniref:Cdc37 N terminal kinase binding-domain-containing protein n=1 Tax=Scheffersomyces xylosifermentans TaxID=1304137 RepID=UPI00315DA249